MNLAQVLLDNYLIFQISDVFKNLHNFTVSLVLADPLFEDIRSDTESFAD